MLKILVCWIMIFILTLSAGWSQSVSEDAIEVEASALDVYGDSMEDTFIKIRVIDKKGKYPTGIEALKREFQCLDKIRPVLLICLEEKVIKTLHLNVLLAPKCSTRIMKFREWANNTCDGLISFHVDGGAAGAGEESWIFRFMVWLRSMFRFFSGDCKYVGDNTPYVIQS